MYFSCRYHYVTCQTTSDTHTLLQLRHRSALGTKITVCTTLCPLHPSPHHRSACILVCLTACHSSLTFQTCNCLHQNLALVFSRNDWARPTFLTEVATSQPCIIILSATCPVTSCTLILFGLYFFYWGKSTMHGKA